MLVWNSIEEPLNILCVAYDTWESEYRIRRIVRMNAHIDVVLIAYRHDSLEPGLHVVLKLSLVDVLIECEKVAELLNRS